MSTSDETNGPSMRVTIEQARKAIRTLIDTFDTLTNGGAMNLQADH